MAFDLTVLPDRFVSKVTFDGVDGCWTWHASLDTAGYGLFRVNRKLAKSHRYAYENLVGPIPQGMVIDHLCRNRGCVNPAHLEVVTSGENTRRSPIHNCAKTHCPKGHEYTPENTWLSPTGRVCKACKFARQRVRRAKQRGLVA